MCQVTTADADRMGLPASAPAATGAVTARYDATAIAVDRRASTATQSRTTRSTGNVASR
jgi:hypothetical protein